MNDKNGVANNVVQFLERAAALHGKSEERKFDDEMYCNILEKSMQSPIEHMFWVAAHAQCAAHFHEVNPEHFEYSPGKYDLGFGIHISCQATIGKYRVDFLLQQQGVAPADIYSPVVVELDGHAFHDKDKRQRSYEKARDRFLVKSGFRVLHFTGSDVVKDPFAVSYEALELLGAFIGSAFEAYDPSNPLGTEP